MILKRDGVEREGPPFQRSFMSALSTDEVDKQGREEKEKEPLSHGLEMATNSQTEAFCEVLRGVWHLAK